MRTNQTNNPVRVLSPSKIVALGFFFLSSAFAFAQTEWNWNVAGSREGWEANPGATNLTLVAENGSLVYAYPGSSPFSANDGGESSTLSPPIPTSNKYLRMDVELSGWAEALGAQSYTMNPGLETEPGHGYGWSPGKVVCMLRYWNSGGSDQVLWFYVDPNATQPQTIILDVTSLNGWASAHWTDGPITKVALEMPWWNDKSSSAWSGAQTRISSLRFTSDPSGGPGVPWSAILENGAFIKTGANKLNATDYQYNHIGLSGTVLRVGPHGFTSPDAPSVTNPSALDYHPFLAQQYWWGNTEQDVRQQPFTIEGGYGPVSPGTIASETPGVIMPETFSQVLTLNGMLRSNLDITVAGNVLSSIREEFVTPNGVWVVQVNDTSAVNPFVLRIQPKDSYDLSAIPKTDGMVITATKTGAATAALAVAGEQTGVIDLTTPGSKYALASLTPNQTVTFYIAPSSSYDPDVTDPGNDAWAKADAARTNGYTIEKQATLAWWSAYNSRSTVVLPASASDLEKWYVRSLYYHGVFFGKTIIPTGLYGWSAFPGGGAICPQYDLIYSHLANLYSNHMDEAKNTVDWIINTLPQARINRTDSQYGTSISHSRGAKYGLWCGYTGDVRVATAPEAYLFMYNNDTTSACAMMATKYLDYTLDSAYDAPVKQVLLECAQLTHDDQVWNASLNAYTDYVKPDIFNQAAAKYCISQSISHGIAETGWSDMVDQVCIPTGTYQGNNVFSYYQALEGQAGQGDAPLLIPVWWYGFADKTDPRLQPSWDWVTQSATRTYTFNRGQMSVLASKLHNSDNAYNDACALYGSDVRYDDTAISEMVYDSYDFQRCPEIAAHGAVMISTIQMLIDADSEDTVEIWPAIPANWWNSGVGFSNLAIKGGALVDATISGRNISVKLTNTSHTPMARTLKVWLPAGTTYLTESPSGTSFSGSYASLGVALPASSAANYLFVLPSSEINLVGVPTETVMVGTRLVLTASSVSGTDTDFFWSSSDEAIATVVSLDATHADFAILAGGTVTITATGNITGRTATFTITVPEPPKTPVAGLSGLAALAVFLTRAAILCRRR